MIGGGKMINVAKLKQQLIGVLVSGFVIFGAYGIWKVVGKIVEQIGV